LLRGASTKVGQKATSNYTACRDLSGRRIRHVNDEKVDYFLFNIFQF
jgi:hypothetical protein